MYKASKAFFLQAISPVHAGSGNDLGVIDLPIQREKHTAFPKIESSSLKGCIREAFENQDDTAIDDLLIKGGNAGGTTISLQDFGNGLDTLTRVRANYAHTIQLLFGYDDDSATPEVRREFEGNSEFSGCLAFTDARLLLFPVKSMRGVFAWITCPMVLKRLAADMEMISTPLQLQTVAVTEGSAITGNETLLDVSGNVILEEFAFSLSKNQQVFDQLKKIPALADKLNRVVILSDDDFTDFVKNSTEVITRIKIDNETGTVATGALFNEEYLPAESLLYFMTFASQVFRKKEGKGIFAGAAKEWDTAMDIFSKGMPRVLQIGGNATIGKGLVQVISGKE